MKYCCSEYRFLVEHGYIMMDEEQSQHLIATFYDADQPLPMRIYQTVVTYCPNCGAKHQNNHNHWLYPNCEYCDYKKEIDKK